MNVKDEGLDFDAHTRIVVVLLDRLLMESEVCQLHETPIELVESMLATLLVF